MYKYEIKIEFLEKDLRFVVGVGGSVSVLAVICDDSRIAPVLKLMMMTTYQSATTAAASASTSANSDHCPLG